MDLLETFQPKIDGKLTTSSELIFFHQIYFEKMRRKPSRRENNMRNVEKVKFGKNRGSEAKLNEIFRSSIIE